MLFLPVSKPTSFKSTFVQEFLCLVVVSIRPSAITSGLLNHRSNMKLFSLFRRKTPSPASRQPVTASVSPSEDLQPMILKTLVIVYDPVVDKVSGKKLSEYMQWNKVDDLTKGYISDIQQVSSGLVQYQITERIDVDAFPAKVNGYVYDAPELTWNVLRNISKSYLPQEADYYGIIERFNILQRVAILN